MRSSSWKVRASGNWPVCAVCRQQFKSARPTSRPLPLSRGPNGAAAQALLNSLGSHPASGKVSKTDFVPSAVLQYDVNDDIMLYGSFTKALNQAGSTSAATTVASIRP